VQYTFTICFKRQVRALASHAVLGHPVINQLVFIVA